MRFGHWRRAALALVAAGAFGVLGVSTARATDWFGQFRTIPREVPAVDFRTGQPMTAPPIPYGHYAKDPYGTVAGAVHGAIGHASGAVHHLIGAAHQLCGACGGVGCGTCGGLGHLGGPCGAAGCGLGAGHGGIGGTCGPNGAGCGLGHGPSLHGGLFGGKTGCGLLPCKTNTTFVGKGGYPIPSPQIGPCPTPQAGLCQPGKPCGFGGLFGSHKGGAGGVCGAHGVAGCGLCGGGVGVGSGGLFSGLCGPGGGTQLCGAGGHGAAAGCGSCGGVGCGLCAGLIGKAHHLLGAAHGAVSQALHIGHIKYFVGPGGPVPLTPGYVPYVVPTRSPRDYFAFPPYGNGVEPDY